jgi:GNAT superfamily N-acetyltransferase
VEIVEATHADVNDRLMKLAAEFYASTKLSDIAPFSRKACEDLVHKTINEETALMLVAKHEGMIVGMIGMHLVLSPFSEECIIANELFWYVDKDHRKTGVGLTLINRALSWAEENLADVVYFVAIEDPDMGTVKKIYEKKKFVPVEHGFMRRL